MLYEKHALLQVYAVQTGLRQFSRSHFMTELFFFKTTVQIPQCSAGKKGRFCPVVGGALNEHYLLLQNLLAIK